MNPVLLGGIVGGALAAFLISSVISYVVIFWLHWGSYLKVIYHLGIVFLPFLVIWIFLIWARLAIDSSKHFPKFIKQYKLPDDQNSMERDVNYSTVCAFACCAVFTCLTSGLFLNSPNIEQIRFGKEIGIDKREIETLSCEIKNVCSAVREARFDCALAGSVNECIKIRMEGRNFSSLCTQEGIPHITVPVQAQPPWVKCSAQYWSQVADKWIRENLPQ
jgi:hypothetical protein